MNTAETMVHNANGIALYFASYPREEAIAGVTDHIQKYWERRMRQQITDYIAHGGGGLHELVLEAVKRLSVPAGQTASK
jgi:formate dehydrogenase subunit delta